MEKRKRLTIHVTPAIRKPGSSIHERLDSGFRRNDETHRLRKHRPNRDLKRNLAQLIKDYPKILPILDRYGISFCAGCYLTLTKTPQQAAAFHAVPDIKKFLEELRSQGINL